MAHAIQPNHRPHEQLRMEAPSQKKQSDKYVSAFVTGESTVDMSFRSPILPKSSDHFKVGIDELTVNLGNLSMLEYDAANDVLFRVLRRGDNTGDQDEDFQMIDGPQGSLDVWRNAFEFKINRPFLTILEILERCKQVASAVGTFINQEGFVQPGGGNVWTAALAAPAAEHEHFRISITSNGQIQFSGNKYFWANFAIEVPLAKYRQILFKDIAQRYISIHPATGALIAQPYVAAGALQLQSAILNPVFDGANDIGAGDLGTVTAIQYVGDGNLLSTLDRRITLEVGCSLPIKNSPLVDHGEEAPDFVLGRYMFHQPYSMSAKATIDPNFESGGPTITVPHLGTITVQGPRDRIVYHHLQPQQKIQVLRLKLWARVRTYNAIANTWGMKTIVCPVDDMDYWHLRLHFTEK